MFRFNVISFIDNTIIVGIHVVHSFKSDVIHVFTRPSIFTVLTFIFEWVVTVELGITFSTVFNSPFIFTHDNTVEDFTRVKSSIIVGITLFHHEA